MHSMRTARGHQAHHQQCSRCTAPRHIGCKQYRRGLIKYLLSYALICADICCDSTRDCTQRALLVVPYWREARPHGAIDRR